MYPSCQHLEVDRCADTFCVRLRNHRLEEEQLSEMTDELFALVKEEGCRKMVLSLGPEPPFLLYSVFLARLVSLQRLLRDREGTLILCDLRPELYRIFEACGLDTQFHFARNFETACATLG